MAAHEFADLSTASSFDASETLHFDEDISASQFRLLSNGLRAHLVGGGKSVDFYNMTNFWGDYQQPFYLLGSASFQFDDGSKILFANSHNGYSLDLHGTAQDDLLVGSRIPQITAPDIVSASGARFNSGGALSPDGRLLVYSSTGPDSGDTVSQVYLRDLETGTTQLLSQVPAADVEPGDRDSGSPSIADNDRSVVFVSRAGNLGASVTPGVAAVYGVDLKFPFPYLISTGPNGVAPNGDCDGAQICGDGSAVVYSSVATNLVAGDVNGRSDIFITGGPTQLVSVSRTGGSANGASWQPSISDDGRYVAFGSEASNLVADDRNGVADIFVRDVDARTTTLISVGSSFRSQDPGISGDGRTVAFYSFDDFGLTGNTSGRQANLFVASVDDPRQVRLVSADVNGVARGIDVDDYASGAKPALSGDGRFIVFASATTRLVAEDNDGFQDVFVKDMLTGEVARLDDFRGGIASSPSISDDGTRISFAFSHTVSNPQWQTVVIDNPLMQAVLAGGDGNDTYQVDRGADRIVESADGGEDRVIASLTYRLPDHVENLVLVGGARNGTGNAEANELTGNDAANRLDGRGGADEMIGGRGNDSYVVDNRGDVVREGRAGGLDTVTASVSSTLAANVEILRLAGSGDLRGVGNGGDNTLVGNRGDNVLDGRGGDDALTGGAGSDQFVLRTEFGTDTITDFDVGRDAIRIAAAVLDVGNADNRLDGAIERAGPGRFSAGAELVVFTADTDGSLDEDAAAAAIGSARGRYEVGDRRIFVVDNGEDTAVYLYTAADDDRVVSADELTALAIVQGAETSLDDYLFGA